MDRQIELQKDEKRKITIDLGTQRVVEREERDRERDSIKTKREGQRELQRKWRVREQQIGE